MNILVSSTRQWNPGDEFILFGVRNLLREALKGEGINWILYDRNPDLFVDGFDHPFHRERIWGNSFHHSHFQCLDMALIAGTPEWMGSSLKRFYRIVIEGHLPLAMLGVGYIDAPISFTEDELYCFKHQLKVATVRDEFASRALIETDIPHEMLPCPGLFASLHEHPPDAIRKIGFIIQTDKTVNQSVPEELSHACAHTVMRLRSKGWSVDVICHYIDEFVEFARTLAPVRYSYDARDYVDILMDYDLIISTRLHATIIANSLGKPSILFYDGDPRTRGAASLFPFIHISSPDKVLDDIDRLDITSSKELIIWKTQMKERYLAILQKGIS